MNNLPDDDTKLTNFLRQHRSIAPSGLPELEDRLMSEIDLRSIHKQDRILYSWRRYLVGGVGLIVTGIVSMTIFQLMNPPEPSIAELNQLNLYLEAHLPSLADHSALDLVNHEDLVDLDPDLF
jgi:hypothetical protein